MNAVSSGGMPQHGVEGSRSVPSSQRAGQGFWWRIAVLFVCLLPLGLVCGTATTDIALSMVALMFLGHVLQHGDWGWLKIRWVPLALVIWCYYIAISFQAIQVMVSLKGALGFGRFLLFGVACQYWLFSHARVRAWMLRAILITLVFAALDAWFQFFWGVDWFGIQAREGASILHPIWPWEQHRYVRLTALSGKFKIGGLLITMAFPAVVHWLLQLHQPHRAAWYRCMCVLAAFLVLAIVPLTAERTSTLWMLLGVVLSYLWIPQTRKGLWYLMLPVVLCWAVVFHAIPSLQQRMLGSIPHIVTNAAANALDSRQANNNIYTALNRTAINLYLAHPVWGVGLKQFDVACRMAPDSINRMRAYRPDGGCNNSPQNMYLELLVNTGTVGALLFMGLMGMWVHAILSGLRFLSRAQHNRYAFEKPYHIVLINQPVVLGVLIALCLRVFPFVTTTSFYFSWGAVAFWWFGAWLLAYLKEAKDAAV